MDFEIGDYQLIIYSAYVKYLRKMEIQQSNASAVLNFKKSYFSIS